MPKDLRALTLAELTGQLARLAQPSFRAKQIFAWVQQKGVTSFDQMANIPKELRAKLAGHFQVAGLKSIKTAGDAETRKFLWQLPDGLTVESVLLDDEGRQTICLSSQVGCKMDCAFCATGRIRFKRDLTAGEIISQVLATEAEVGTVDNLVFMGMGEPLDNYDNVLKSIRILNDPAGRNFGLRRITVSTSGLVPAIDRLAREGLPLKLAVSLNAADDKTRDQLMPINKKNDLRRLIPALAGYIEASGRRGTIEYVLMKDINDSPADARRLAELLHGLKVNINLIAFNPWRGCRFEAPPPQAIKAFRQILERAGFEVVQRYIRGQHFGAACGQLTGGYF